MDNLTPKNHNKLSTSTSKMTTNSSASPSKNAARSPMHDDHKPSSTSSSSASSSSDSKTPKYKSTTCELKTSRRFLNCIGKHLGCPFLQQNLRHLPQQQLHAYIYNSQDDLPSSSTDSFSLSYERGSHMGFQLTGSNIDLSYSGAENLAQQSKAQKEQINHRHQQQSQHASRNTLSSSAYSNSSHSPAFCSFDVDCLVDIYNDDGDDEEDVCVSLKRYHQRHTSDVNVAHSCSSGTDSNSSDEDDECSTHEECSKQQQRKNKHEQHQHQHQQHHDKPKQSSASHKRVHLSRTSIASSVSRMLSHFASSTSMRSLSCSSTPLRCFKDSKPKEADDVANLNDRNKNEASHGYDKNKKHSLPNTSSSSSNGSRSSSSGNSSSGSGSGGSSNSKNKNRSSSSNSSHSTSNGKKKEKKQQSILRPPVHYVYMKGMSGLYSRVPRYTVCSPYAMH